jgi:hypothetical protein
MDEWENEKKKKDLIQKTNREGGREVEGKRGGKANIK